MSMNLKGKFKFIHTGVIFGLLFIFSQNTFAAPHAQQDAFQACIDREILQSNQENPIDPQNEWGKTNQLSIAQTVCIREIMNKKKDFSFCENDIILKWEEENPGQAALSNECYEELIEDEKDQLVYFDYVKRRGLHPEVCDQAYEENLIAGDNCFANLVWENGYSPHALCALFKYGVNEYLCQELSTERFETRDFNDAGISGIDSYQDCKALLLDGFRERCFNDFSYKPSKFTFWFLFGLAILSFYLRLVFRKKTWRYIFTALFISLVFILFDLTTLLGSDHNIYQQNSSLVTRFNIFSVLKNLRAGCEQGYILLRFYHLLLRGAGIFATSILLMWPFRKSKRKWPVPLAFIIYALFLLLISFVVAFGRLGCG